MSIFDELKASLEEAAEIHKRKMDLSHQEKVQEKVRRAKKDNPDLPAGFISDILIAKEEVDLGETFPYKRSSKREDI